MTDRISLGVVLAESNIGAKVISAMTAAEAMSLLFFVVPQQ